MQCKHVISSQTETLSGEIQKNLGAPAATGDWKSQNENHAKNEKHEKVVRKNGIWVEPTRENDSVSRILLFSEKIPEGMLVNTDQGSQYGPTIGQAQWRDRRILKKGRPMNIVQCCKMYCKHAISAQRETLSGEI